MIITYEKELGESYIICLKRNERVLEKLTEDQEKEFIRVLREQRDVGIISVVEHEVPGAYYNPIVLVWKNSLISPLRICFDGSQKSSSGVSGNDLQLAGPPLQPSVFGQMLNFGSVPLQSLLTWRKCI